MVCAEGFSQWVPFHTIAELVGASVAHVPSLTTSRAWQPPAAAPVPTRAGAVIAGLVFVPLVWLTAQAILCDGFGLLGPTIVLVLGIVTAMVVGGTSLRLKTPKELLNVRLLAVPVLGLFLVGEGLGLASGVAARLRHGRIVDALSSPDACAVEGVSKDDVDEFATESEKRSLELRPQECAAKRAAAQCVKLAAAVEHRERTLPDAPDSTTASLAVRVTEGALVLADLSLSKKDLQCEALWPLLVGVAAKVPTPWSGVAPPAVSEDMVASLVSLGLAPAVSDAIRADAETAAKTALGKNKTTDMAGGKAGCDGAAALKVETGPSCLALGKRYAQVKAREDAVDAVRQAAEDAKEERANRRTGGGFVGCMTACNQARSPAEKAQDNARARQCNEKCGNDTSCLMNCDPATSSCQIRCAQRYPSALNGL